MQSHQISSVLHNTTRNTLRQSFTTKYNNCNTRINMHTQVACDKCGIGDDNAELLLSRNIAVSSQ